MPHLIFIISVLTSVGLGLGLSAAFNVFIDPFALYGSPAVSRLNEKKPKLDTHGRLHKAVAIERLRPDSVILGSSRAALGLNPQHVPGTAGLTVYNCALDSANMYEIMRYFEHAAYNQPRLKQLIIGLDYQMFNGTKRPPNEFDDSRLCKTGITQSDAIDTLLSVDACKASVTTVMENARSPQATLSYFQTDGQRDAQSMLRSPSAARWTTSIHKADGEIAQYKFSGRDLEYLRCLTKKCDAHHIDLHLFISPSHAVEWEQLKVDGEWNDFENWKRELAKIHPFWDFSGYNSVTSEPLGPHMKNYIDASHYSEAVGDLVLRIITSQPGTYSGSFGKYCCEANVDSVIKEITQERASCYAKCPNWTKAVTEFRSNPSSADRFFDQKSASTTQEIKCQ